MKRILFASLLWLAGCFRVDTPPQPSIVGLNNGILPDASAPLVLSFHEPIAPQSLRFRVIRYEIDAEGNLYDEDPDPATTLNVIYDSETGAGGKGELDEARQSFRVTFPSALPIGPQLAVVIEAGLADDQGNSWRVRQVLKFGFKFSCSGSKATTFPKAGKFFWLIQVEKPVPAQIQLFADMRVNPETGEEIGQFTNGERDPKIDCSKYGLTCGANQRCRTLPAPACVEPSEKAGTVDEWVDYFPDATSDVGFSFTIRGCIVDQPDGSFNFANLPASVITKKPAVTVDGIRMNSSLKPDGQTVLRGTGTFTADQVSLGAPPNSVPSGAGVGTHTERQIPDDKAPAIPPPPDK
jgi:hypothetical protein